MICHRDFLFWPCLFGVLCASYICMGRHSWVEGSFLWLWFLCHWFGILSPHVWLYFGGSFFFIVSNISCVFISYIFFCLIFQVALLLGQDPLFCLWNLIFCLPLDLFCLYSFPFSFVVAKASQTRPECWDPREVRWGVKKQGLGGEDTHQAGLWKRMWDVWVWYGVVMAAQRVVWVDVCREDPGRSLDVGFSTRRGCEKRQGSLLKI